jgi:hypothetical protein
MRIYVEGETLLIDVSESMQEESLDVFVIDHGARQRVEGRLTITSQNRLKLKLDRSKARI